MDQKNSKHHLRSFEKKYEAFGKNSLIGFRVRKNQLWGIAIILCCLVLMTVSGCAGSSLENKATINESVATDQFSNETASVALLPKDVADVNSTFDASKIIYSGDIRLYVEDYQTGFDKISNYTAELGGFVQDSGSNYISEESSSKENSGYINIRVPFGKFNEAMTQIQTFGSSISANVNSTNISQQYQDVQGQLNNLRIQEERLLEYLKQASNITDMLAIETELNRVRTEIDSLSSTIKNWDTEMAYSTIYVSLYEKELSATTVKSPFSEILTKIGEGFITSINVLLYIISFLIVLIFRLLPFIAIAGLGFYIFVKIRKRIKQKKIDKENDNRKNS
jgi:virulence-associated protein VapD